MTFGQHYPAYIVITFRKFTTKVKNNSNYRKKNQIYQDLKHQNIQSF